MALATLGAELHWGLMLQPYEHDGFTGCEMVGIHEAFQKGDPHLVRSALRNPPDFPNCPMPGGGNILEYAIYHSPLKFIQSLLELGVVVNYDDHAGFPCLIAALSTQREDKLEILKLLLQHSADVQQRGVNDYTPLHYAVSLNDVRAVELLLAHGADPNARTNIDDHATPLEEAEIAGRGDSEAAQVLRRLIRSEPSARSFDSGAE